MPRYQWRNGYRGAAHDPEDEAIHEDHAVPPAEAARLESGDITCPYCCSEPCKPGCLGLDVHSECAWCGNVCGHRSVSCPGRYE